VPAFEKLIKEARPYIDYKLDILAENSKLDDNIGKANYIKSALEILNSIEDKVERQLYVPKVERIGGVQISGSLRRQPQQNVEKPEAKVKVQDGKEAAMKTLEEINSGIASGTNAEIKKKKEDCEKRLNNEELKKFRDENLDKLTVEEIGEINKILKGLQENTKWLRK